MFQVAQTCKAGGEGWRTKEFQKAGPRRHIDLSPKEMSWHTDDHRQPSNVKWIWIEIEEWGRSTTRWLDQSRVSGAGRAGALFCWLSRRLSWRGPTTSHVLLTEASMNYYILFCYRSPWFIADKQLGFQRSTMSGGPHRCPQRDRIHILSKEKHRREWTKTHCLLI